MASGHANPDIGGNEVGLGQVTGQDTEQVGIQICTVLSQSLQAF